MLVKPAAIVLLLGAMFLHGLTANATSFNFGEFANGLPNNGSNGEKNVEGLTFDSQGLTNSPTGLSLVATASLLTGQGDASAYLDSEWNGGLAGLGVCKNAGSPGSGQCSPSSDDNITGDEVLTLTFAEEVTLSEILFKNGEHELDFEYGNNTTALFGVAIDMSPASLVLGDFVAYSLSPNPFLTPLTGTVFNFISAATLNQASGAESELYISVVNASPVPEPGSLMLLGTGLASLGLWGWRRQSAKVS